MSRFRSFLNKSTNSKGKIQSECYSDALIAPIVKPLLKANRDLKIGVLIGSSKGLNRHLKRYLRQLGALESQVYIFEIEPKTAKGLRRKAAKLGLKVKVFEGEMLSQIDILCRGGTEFAYIEFDGTKPFGTFDFKLYQLANRFNIPVIVSQGATRGTSSNFRQECRRLGFRQTLDAVQNYKRYELKRIAPKMIKNKLRSYTNEFITYKGVAGMYMHIAIKVA